MVKVLASLLVVGLGAVAKLPETVLPIGSDTGMYATYGRMVLEGSRPYVDFYDVHPPLVYWYWALVEAIVGADWSRTCLGSWGSLAPQPCIGLLAHALDFGLTCVAALLTYAIARRLGQPAGVGLLAALFVVWFANESMISMEGSTPGKLTLVPSLLAVYAFAIALGPGSKTWRWALVSGAAGALAGLAKQPGLLTLVALLAYTASGLFRGARVIPRAPTICLGLLAGAAVVGLVTVLLLALTGSVQGFLDEAWLYNAQRFLIGYWQTAAGLTSPATRIDHVVTEAAGLLFVGALIGGLALIVSPTHRHERLLLVWAVISLGSVAGFREFAQVVPGLALLAAIGIGRLWQAAGRDGLGLGRPFAGRIALVALFGAVFMLSSNFQLVELRRAWFERGPRGTPADPELIGTYLRQSTPPGPIFVWGNAGQIYAYSGLENASRFLISEFTDKTSPRPDLSRAEVIVDLESKPPGAIVLAPHIDDPGLRLDGFPAFQQLLDSCYRRVDPGGPVPSWGVYLKVSTTTRC